MAGWQAGMPHLPLGAGLHAACVPPVRPSRSRPPVARAAAGRPGAAADEGAWHALLRASGRSPDWSPVAGG